MSMTEENKPTAGWILYDSSCGFCRRWIPFWEKALLRRGFGIAALQEEWVKDQLEISPEKLQNDLRLLLADGTHLAGADVYRHAMRRIWWALPLYFVSLLPGCRQVFDWSYRTFARNRFRVSAICGFK